MQPGDFCVLQTSGWEAHVIQAFTRSPYNHAYGYLGGGLMIEAQPGGAKIGKVSKYNGYKQLQSKLPLTTAQSIQIAMAYKKQEGIEYGWGDVFAVGLGAIGIELPKLDDPDSVFCSQLVAIGLLGAKFAIKTQKQANRITPGDLADIINNQPIPKRW